MSKELDRMVAEAAELMEAIPERGVQDIPATIAKRYVVYFGVTSDKAKNPNQPYCVANDQFERQFEKVKWTPEFCMSLIRDHGSRFIVSDKRKEWDAQQARLASNAQEIRDADEARADALAK